MRIRLLDHLCWLFPLLFLGFGIFVIIYCNTLQHERVHQQIMLYDGCGDVEIYIGVAKFEDSYARCIDDSYIESELAQMLHSQNEIVGYNNTTVLYCMVMCTLYLGMFLMRRD